MAKKTRIDAWWSKLTADQQEAAYRKSFTSPHGVVRDWIAAEFGVAKPSQSAYYRFLEAYSEEWSESSAVRAGVAVRLVKNLAEKAKVDDQAFVDSLKALSAEAALSGGDMAAAQKLLSMAVDLRRVNQDRDKLQLDREKFEAAERRLAAAKGAVSDETLTDEERVAKVKSIFGIN